MSIQIYFMYQHCFIPDGKWKYICFQLMIVPYYIYINSHDYILETLISVIKHVLF